MRNLKLTLEYEGTQYHGWQVQPGLVTIQQAIQERLARILQEQVVLVAAGRTDAGVHALEQVANFHCSSSIPADSLQKALNSLLPRDIAVTGVEEVPEDFSARFRARSKVYLYRILNRTYPSSFWRRYSWFLPRRLDVPAMERALPSLLGRHDFSAFRASGCTARSVIRTLHRADLTRQDDMIEMRFEANAFLRYMVRNIVGTLVQIGLGKRPAENLGEVLAGRDRRQAGPTVPACGLTMEKVFLGSSDPLLPWDDRV